MRLFFTVFIIVAFVASATGHIHAEGVPGGDLDALINEAIDNNPRVQAAYENWKAATYRIKQVSVLPDPTARYTYFGESVETKVGPQKHKYGVSQSVPFPGKLHLKGRAEFKKADVLREKYEATKREIIKDVKFVYYDIFWVDRAIDITEEEKGVLSNLEKVAGKKFEVAHAPQQDVIKAQVEISKLIDKLFKLRQHRKSLAAKLNALLSRPNVVMMGKVKDIELDKFNYTLDSLHNLAGTSRQELLAANINIERAKYEKSLAGLNFLPDFTFGFDYIQVGDDTTTLPDDGQDAWMTTFAVHIPIWLDKQVAELKEKSASLRASRENFEDVKNNVIYEVEDVYYKINTYKEIVSLYKTALVPQTEQAFNAAKTAYEAGKVDFLNWLDSERVLLKTKLAYYKAIVDYEKSIAYLERVVGRDL
ncbi:MAG: TolC family protein [Candidatus Omnitrophica bacterium]|nr:TolC family protein [Candidatus Omnitrophota bacterium]